jgi:hypothetical protein
LFSLTTGGFNTAVGFLSLRSDTTGQLNTAIGAGALLDNNGASNTATGAAALLSNTTGGGNTATGLEALFGNTSGHSNTAFGLEALFSNTTGSDNTAIGVGAMQSSNGDFNTAGGYNALLSNTTGANNTAFGSMALISDSTGSNNIALGTGAGQNLTTGDYNIDIGNDGVAGEAGTIRVGDDNHNGATFIAGIYGMSVSGLTVVMDSSDHLGTLGSSRRFKDDIQPMAQASEAILRLKPVTFRYKKEIDPRGTSQFGLVAEDVEKVNADLIVCDKEGRPYSVRYDAVNAMLLNEFLKEHKTVQEQGAAMTQQRKDFEAAIAQQQKQIEALTATVKEQAAQIQKVSAHLEISKPAPEVAENNQ